MTFSLLWLLSLSLRVVSLPSTFQVTPTNSSTYGNDESNSPHVSAGEVYFHEIVHNVVISDPTSDGGGGVPCHVSIIRNGHGPCR